MKHNLTDKEFFKIINKGCRKYGDDITDTFPLWVLEITYSFLTEDDLDKAVYGLTGNDESIDAFFINESTKDIYFVQCKSAINERNLKVCKKEWLSYLYDIPNKLENEEYIEQHKNTRVQEIASDYAVYKKKGYNLNFAFFHLGHIADYKILDSYNTEITKSFEYYGFEEIKDLYFEHESRLSLTEPEFFNLNITYSNKAEIIDQKIGGHYTLISVLTGDEIIRLREDYKYKLFDKNVRYNLGLNKINKTIIQSATESKNDFYFLNNGLTITSLKFKKKDATTIRVERPQIINGAQTVDSIYAAYLKRFNKLKRVQRDVDHAKKKALEEFKDLKVMFRIIQTHLDEKDFEMNVIKCNNTQNAVQVRDFYSNNPEQIELQEQFATLGIFYEIKRGERNYIKKNPHNRLKKKLSEFEFNKENLDIEKLASLLRAYHLEPGAKEVGAKNILNDDDAYQMLFGSSIADITIEKVKEMTLAYNIFSVLEDESKRLNRLLKLLLHIDDRPKEFYKIKTLICESLVLNDVIKSKFTDFDTYNQNNERNKKLIRKFSCFTQGKYFALAIFRLILEECSYDSSILKTELYRDKEFIKDKIVKAWLPTVLSKLLVKEFDRAAESDGISMAAFFLRPKSFSNIWEMFEQFDAEENQEFTDIFPLRI
jgi:AIPR protein